MRRAGDQGVVEEALVPARVLDDEHVGLQIVCPQNEMSRAVSQASMPIRLLNHWRLASTRLTSAIGTSQVRAA